MRGLTNGVLAGRDFDKAGAGAGGAEAVTVVEVAVAVDPEVDAGVGVADEGLKYPQRRPAAVRDQTALVVAVGERDRAGRAAVARVGDIEAGDRIAVPERLRRRMVTRVQLDLAGGAAINDIVRLGRPVDLQIKGMPVGATDDLLRHRQGRPAAVRDQTALVVAVGERDRAGRAAVARVGDIEAGD